MKRLQLYITGLLSCILINNTIGQTASNFILTDVDGVEHNLYEDYLDQGKTVLISFGASWNPWDSVWVSSGVMQEFHTRFAGDDGEAAILFIDPLGSSIEELSGNGNGTGFDFISNSNFPIITTEDESLLDNYQVNYFPTIRMICPDRTLYSDDIIANSTFPPIEELGYGNLTSADVIADVMFNYCGTLFDGNQITAKVYFDENIDCEFNNESGIPRVIATLEGPNGTFNRISNSNGLFFSSTEQGDYKVSVAAPNHLWEACNNDQTVTFSGTDEQVKLEFGMQVDQYCPHPTLNISTPFLRRCFDTKITVNYCNEGTEVLSDAIIEVQLHDYLELLDANHPFSQNGNLVTFDLGEVGVLECGTIKMEVFVDCDAELEEEVCYSATITDPCNNGTRTYEFECQEIIGSFDPNDKRAFPLSGSDDYTIKPNEMIKYQIRFQNTGNDTAFTVVVEDLISPLLDLSTFETGVASHPFEVEIDEMRNVRFIFENIMLPDSNVNLIGSNGYLTYYINQNPDLSNGTQITNEAGIFFDFNEAVITNTTTHTIDDGLTDVKDLNVANFDISPNPAKDFVLIQLSKEFGEKGSLSIHNITGKKVLNQRYNDTKFSVNLESLQSGIYLIKIEDHTGLKRTQKLIIE